MGRGLYGPRGLSSEVRSGTSIGAVPIYEFDCADCGHGFEELVGSHVGLDAEDVRCPECGAEDVVRRVSSTYAPIHRRMTDGQKRRADAERPRVLERNKAEFARKRKEAARRKGGGGS